MVDAERTWSFKDLKNQGDHRETFEKFWKLVIDFPLNTMEIPIDKLSQIPRENKTMQPTWSCSKLKIALNNSRSNETESTIHDFSMQWVIQISHLFAITKRHYYDCEIVRHKESSKIVKDPHIKRLTGMKHAKNAVSDELWWNHATSFNGQFFDEWNKWLIRSTLE